MKTGTRFAYVAGRFERREELHTVVRRLGALNIRCTSRWITEEPDISQAHPKQVEAFKCEWSIKDFNDVKEADTLIAFSEDLTVPTARPENNFSGVAKVGFGHGTPGLGEARLMVPALWARGGRHVEFGLAVAWEKRIVVIGPQENIFHWLPMVEHYPNFDTFIEHTRKHNVVHSS